LSAAPETKPAVETPQDWRSALTGDHASLATDKTLANIRGKDWTEAGPTLAKMLVESQKVIGKRSEGMVKVPGPGAKPEEVAAYREAIGVPKVPSDYKVELPADAPEGLAIDPVRFESYAKVFHSMNLTNDQVNGIVGWAMKEQATTQKRQAEEFATQLDGLAGEWGVDVFNRRAGNVQALVRRYADPETIKWLDASGLTNHPGLFKMLYPIAQQFVEDEIIEPVGDSREGDLSNIDQRLDANREAYLKEPEGSPRRQALLDERERLVKIRAEVAGIR